MIYRKNKDIEKNKTTTGAKAIKIGVIKSQDKTAKKFDKYLDSTDIVY